MSQTPCSASYNLRNAFVSSSVHTVRIAVYEPARILLAAITVFLATWQYS